MIDKRRLQERLADYKREFVQRIWPGERYKWEAVQWFQDHWDVAAEDFPAMLAQSLAKTGNLLASVNNFPARMIVRFAEVAPEEVRGMFTGLFDESGDVCQRIETFKAAAGALLEQHGNGAGQHFQNENAITTYLWLRYPDRYYIYKLGVARAAAGELAPGLTFKKGAYGENIRNLLAFYGEICGELRRDQELVNLFQAQRDDRCYSDPQLHTLTIDVAFFISNASQPQYGQLPLAEAPSPPPDAAGGERRCWWLNASPQIWSFQEIAVGETVSYTLVNDNGNKRRIYQNFLDARAGDLVIGYASAPAKRIEAICRVAAEQNGEEIVFEKVEELASPVPYSALEVCPELYHMESFLNPMGSLFKVTPEECRCIFRLIREENPPPPPKSAANPYTKADFLNEVFMPEAKYDRLTSVLRRKKNLILQGAPGVGKTFAAKRLAYSLMGERDESRVEFVQFHQNYSYEDFVMGYKPSGEGFSLQYGVFHRFCSRAAQCPGQDFFFIIDEINRGNLSKIFGELLLLIEGDYRGTSAALAYGGRFSVPKNLYLIGMMNTAGRSLALIDYALRRRFSFFDMEPGFDTEGFYKYQQAVGSELFDALVAKIQDLNREIAADRSLGRGFCIGHSYFCGAEAPVDAWLREVVEYDVLPMLAEYWFDDSAKLQRWENMLRGVFQ